MMFKTYLPTFALMLGLILTNISCKKTDETAATAPTVKVMTPEAGENFAGGQIIKIKGETADVDGLHTLSIKITDDKTSAVLYTSSPAVLNLKTFTFDAAWTAKVTDWTDATVTITAANHKGQTTVNTLKIKIWL